MSPAESRKWRQMTIKIAMACIGIETDYDVASANCELFVTLVVVLPIFYHWLLHESEDSPSLTASVRPICVSVQQAQEEVVMAKQPLGLSARIQCPGMYVF